MIYLALTFGVFIVSSSVVIWKLVEEVRETRRDAAIERKDLSDKVIALSKPEALPSLKLENGAAGAVSYVADEVREAEHA